MTIVNCEETAPRPVFHLFKLRFDDVEDDGYAILVIITNDTLMRICWVAADNTILLTSKLGRMIWLYKPFDLLLLHLHILLLLLNCHDETTIGRQLILTFWLLHSRSTAASLTSLWLLNPWVWCWWLRMTCIFVALCWRHALWASACSGSGILSIHFGLTAWVLNSVLIVSLICVVLLVHLTVVTWWLVTDTGARPDSIDTLAVCLTLAAWLRWILAWLHIRILTIAIHVVHLEGVLTCLILCIAVLLAQFLLLVQKKLLRTMIVHSVTRLMVSRWHTSVLVVLVIEPATSAGQILRLAMLDCLIAWLLWRVKLLPKFGVRRLRRTRNHVAILLPNYFGNTLLGIGYVLICSVIINMRLIHVPVLLLNFALVGVLVAACMLHRWAVHLRMVVHESTSRSTLHLLLMLVDTCSELHPRRPDVALHLLGL